MTDDERRTHDTPGRRDADMAQHTVIDKVSNGPKKGLVAIIGLLVTLVGLQVGVLTQTFNAGRFAATTVDHIESNRRDIDSANLQLQGVITSLQSIVIVDSVQNFQIRQNILALTRIERQLEQHRVVSEHQ